MKTMTRRSWYAIHRWLGLIVGIQMLLWSTGGVLFSWRPIDVVRGTAFARPDVEPVLASAEIRNSPAEAVRLARSAGVDTQSVNRVVLRQRFGHPTYELFDGDDRALCTVNAVSGVVGTRISEQQAAQVAEQDFIEPVKALKVEYLKGEPPMEFRSGSMPVYRVTVDDVLHTNIYVHPVTGDVIKRRNDRWRRFDFFWMLHTMNYNNRDNFHHRLLTTMGMLAMLTSASGLVLWWWRTPWYRRRAKRTLQP